MKLEPSETQLIGVWTVDGGRVVADDACKRIEWLVTECLEEIRRDATGWDTLYRDPHDGRYWERVYVQGDRHAGGPPTLRVVTPDQAREKYGLTRGRCPLTL